jgi:hypothetical protein
MTDLLLPTDDAFGALDKTAQKQALVSLLDNFLDHAAAANRALDDWERAAFRYAVTCLRHDMISAAIPELKRLTTPALQRPAGIVPKDKYPQTLTALRAELQDLLGER